jgi:hypothetical protein
MTEVLSYYFGVRVGIFEVQLIIIQLWSMHTPLWLIARRGR